MRCEILYLGGMEKAARQKLKQFLEDRIPFAELKKVGFWPKGTRKTDYEKIASRVCVFFGIKNVFDYDKIRFNKSIDKGCPTTWPELIAIDQTDLTSQDRYLN